MNYQLVSQPRVILGPDSRPIVVVEPPVIFLPVARTEQPTNRPLGFQPPKGVK